MAEVVELAVAGKEDISVGYGDFTQTVWGTPTAFTKLNTSHFWLPYVVSFSATPVFDLENGQMQTITLTGDVTSSTIVNGSNSVPAGARIVLRIVQDGTGSRAFTFPADVLGSDPNMIDPAADAITRIELQYNGTDWEFAEFDYGVEGGNDNRLAKFLGPVVIPSDFSDDGEGDARYGFDVNGDTRFWIFNNTDGVASRAILRIGGKTSSDDDIAVDIWAQKAANTDNGWNSAIVMRSEDGAVNGMFIGTDAGPLQFQVEGTDTVGAFFKSPLIGPDSTYPINLELGTASAEGDFSTPLLVKRSQDASSDIRIWNDGDGTQTRATFRAQVPANSAEANVYFGATSQTYSFPDSFQASSGFMWSDENLTNGIFISTEVGPIVFQPEGRTTQAGFFKSTTALSTHFNLHLGEFQTGVNDSQICIARRDQNASTDIVCVNVLSAAASARAAFRAVGNSGDIYLGVTTGDYSEAGSFTASTGFVWTGVDTTGGLVLRAQAGHIFFQPNGITTTTVWTATQLQFTGVFRVMNNVTAYATSGTSLDIKVDGLGGHIVGAAWSGVTVDTPGPSGAAAPFPISYVASEHVFYVPVGGAIYTDILPMLGIFDDGITINGATEMGIGTLNLTAAYYVNDVQVVSDRNTGWTAWVGATSKASFDTATATLGNVRETLKALLDALTTHGLIGT